MRCLKLRPELLNLQTIVQDRPLGRPDYERVRSVVDDSLQARAGWLAGDTSRMGRSQVLHYVDDIDHVPTPTSPQETWTVLPA